jgi:hypothetical protein
MRFAPQTIPASGAGPFYTAGGRASSGLEPCESEPLRLPGGKAISTISRRRLVHIAGYPSGSGHR